MSQDRGGRRRRHGGLWAGMVLTAWAALAWASGGEGGSAPAAGAAVDPGDRLVVAPHPALGCLTPESAQRGQPEYPEKLLEARIGGEVKVELRFDGPDAAPSVEFLDPRTSDALEVSVFHHVRRFRVPCLAQEAAPLRLTQTYAFSPHDGRKVTWMPPRDADEARQERLSECVRHPGRAGFGYPAGPLRDGEYGQVVVRMTFKAADAAPDVTVLSAPMSSGLKRDAMDKASGYRMACHSGAPVSVIKIFTYHIDGFGQAHALEDMSLMRFLGAVRNLDEAPVQFDLDRMGCPFDLRVQYLQPHARNEVGELEGSHPQRRPLMDWLATLELNIPDKLLANAVYGDRFTLSIPCGKIDL